VSSLLQLVQILAGGYTRQHGQLVPLGFVASIK
jgi:hypothetical protein